MGGVVAVGAEILLDSIDAPAIIQGLGGVLISGIVDGLIPQQTIPDSAIGENIQGPITARKGILNGIKEAFLKAATDLYGNTLYNITTLGALIDERGFKGAMDAFIGSSLKQSTIESLYVSTTDIADYAFQQFENEATIYTLNGLEVKEIVMENSGGRAVMVFDAETNDLVRLEENGRVLEGDLRVGPDGRVIVFDGSETSVGGDGSLRHSVYVDGKLMLHQDMRDGVHLDYYAQSGSALKINQNGSLHEGILENVTTGTKYVVKESRVQEIIERIDSYKNESGAVQDVLSYKYDEGIGELRKVIDEHGNVISASINLSNNTEFQIDPEKLKNLSLEALSRDSKGVIMTTEDGQTIIFSVDGKVIFTDDPEGFLQRARDGMRTATHGIEVSEDKTYDYDQESATNLGKQYGSAAGGQMKANIDLEKDNYANQHGGIMPSIQQDLIKLTVKTQKLQNNPNVLEHSQTHSIVYDGSAEGAKIKICQGGDLSLVTTAKSNISKENGLETFAVAGNTTRLLDRVTVGTSVGVGGKVDLMAGLPDPNRSASIQNNIEFSILAQTNLNTSEAEAALVFQTKVRLNGYLHTEEVKIKAGVSAGDDDFQKQINEIFDKLSGNTPANEPFIIDIQTILDHGVLGMQGMDATVNDQIRAAGSQVLLSLQG